MYEMFSTMIVQIKGKFLLKGKVPENYTRGPTGNVGPQGQQVEAGAFPSGMLIMGLWVKEAHRMKQLGDTRFA